jgi:hypothetical protein
MADEYRLPITKHELFADARKLTDAVDLLQGIIAREHGRRDRYESYGFDEATVHAMEQTARALAGMKVERTSRVACLLLGRPLARDAALPQGKRPR